MQSGGKIHLTVGGRSLPTLARGRRRQGTIQGLHSAEARQAPAQNDSLP
jgi:hypothetical protein